MLRELFSQDNLAKKIESNEKKFQDLLIKIEEADRETTEIFEQLEVRPEQIQKILSDKENFSEEHWEEIQRQMGEIEKKVSTRRDLNQLRRTYKERSEIQQQWIFVR
ncbi:MAG: hypothetical protein Q8K75_12920 [Chlamydiales bacterium]|nr:hypothetical protein [Chlamydiales bacterium]